MTIHALPLLQKAAIAAGVAGVVAAAPFVWAAAEADPPQPAASAAYPNPFIPARADPWIHRASDGRYYFIATVPEYDRIVMRRSATLAGLPQAEERVVWRSHESGPMSHLIWAPELHRVDGVWTILYAASPDPQVFNVRMYVLTNPSEDPFAGEWTEQGRIQTPVDSFALDATTFEHRGKRYLVWAQKPVAGPGDSDAVRRRYQSICSGLYIAEWDGRTGLGERQARLTLPEFDWEMQKYPVNEGPAVLVRNGRVLITYSASATNHHYCMGMLWADEGADLLDAASWSKSPSPVFKSSVANSQYGPGHNGFTVSEDGADLLVYHARNYKGIEGNELANPDRHARIKPFEWGADGMPVFGQPPADSRPSNSTSRPPVDEQP